MCKCKNGARELRATAYTVTTSAFTITASPACGCCGPLTRLCNGECFRLITCLAFPTVATLVPVSISIGGTAYPVLDNDGNTLRSDQIRCRKCYKLKFGTSPAHFQVQQELCPSQATPTCVNIPTATTASAVSTPEVPDVKGGK